jgi:kumamolisin
MAERKLFTNSVKPLPETGITPHGLAVNAMVAGVHPDETMKLLFSLDTPNEAELQKKVESGETLSPEEINKEFAGDPEEAKKLAAWLKAQGYSNVTPNADNTGVYAEAPASTIAKSLAVDMVRVTKAGLSYTAARNAPSMPADVADKVQEIVGLQPFRQLQKHFRMRRPGAGTGGGPRASAPSASASNGPPYFVKHILKAYGADGLTVTGKGETIAILIDTVPKDSDLQQFWKSNNSSATIGQIDKINVANMPLPPPEGEETLDVSWASGIAPGAKIKVYASGSLSFVSLDLALDRILQDVAKDPTIRQLSISLGLGEKFMAPGEVKAQNRRFLRLAAAGVNVFVSSGDAGSNPDVSGHNPIGDEQAEYESSDPNVVGVGGTTLRLGSGGNVSAEVAWSMSGGGTSIFFDRPSWQKGDGVGGTKRLVPDVAAAADPDTGAFLVLQGEPTQIGGTSWSAPVWAGFCALMNEARVAAGQPRLPFLNPLIYPLMKTASFRDITDGSNGAHQAGKGYDQVTGIGVPNVKELISALTRPKAASAQTRPKVASARPKVA